MMMGMRTRRGVAVGLREPPASAASSAPAGADDAEIAESIEQSIRQWRTELSAAGAERAELRDRLAAATLEPDRGELQRTLTAAKTAHRARQEYKFGLTYLRGSGGVRRDPFAALDWLRRAARRGDAKAMAALGTLLLSGEAGVADEGEASRWLDAAARKASACDADHFSTDGDAINC